MKKILFTTHTLIFILGFLVAASIFIFYEMPYTHRYVVADPLYIKLAEDRKPEDYSAVLQEDYLGSLYLNHPVYFLKREEGKKILKGLAKRGYTPSAGTLFSHYINKYKFTNNDEQALAYLMKAHKWAMFAAKQGDYIKLHIIFHIYDIYEYKDDVTEELALLEKAAMESASHVFATDLSVYYELHEGNKEKAEKWLRIAEEIYKAPYQEPVCTTITPRKVSYTVPKP